MSSPVRQPDEIDLFEIIWRALAEYSLCDGWGGMEQTRVLAEWEAAERTVGIAEFIIARANIGSPGAN